MIARLAKAFSPLFLIVALATAYAGCSDRAPLVPGKPCLIDSECNNPLACTFGKCHEACQNSGDCPYGELCVYADSTPGAATARDACGVGGDEGGSSGGDTSKTSDGSPRLRVCLLEPKCGVDSYCPEPLVCGRDLKCRNECEEDRDCPVKTYKCVPGGPGCLKVCAEPGALGNTGELIARSPDGAVASPAPNSDAGDDATVTVDAPVADGGAADGAIEAAGGDRPATDGGADTPAGDGGQVVLTMEMEPNDDRDASAPYEAGTPVAAMISSTDFDFYSISVPPGDKAGGYFMGSLTNVGPGIVHATVFSPLDNDYFLNSDGAGTGASSKFLWAAAPGASFYLKAYSVTAKPFVYTFQVDYHKLDDAYEPNNTRDEPAPITLGMPISAYFFNGFSTSAVPVNDQDWYILELNPGPLSIRVESVPKEVRLQLAIYNEDYAELALKGAVGPGLGASFEATGTIPIPTKTTTQKYRICLYAFTFTTATLVEKATHNIPEIFTLPYKMTVTQPLPDAGGQ